MLCEPILRYTRRLFFDNISFAADKVSVWLLTEKRTVNENSVAGPPLKSKRKARFKGFSFL